MSSTVRSIGIPNFFYIEENARDKLEDILCKEGIAIDRCLIVSGTGYTCSIADDIARRLDSTSDKIVRLCINSNDTHAINSIEHAIAKDEVSVVVAVGGGKVLDTVKYACSNQHKPILAFPTALSNDGISSPIAVVRLEGIESVGAKPPIGIVVDIDVVKNAPRHTILAGVGDLISNISAVEDWRLAHEHKGVQIDRFAEILSRNAAERFIYYVLKNGKSGSISNDDPSSKYKRFSDLIHDSKFLTYLAEGLIQSGIAMSIAGSSRPASGAEHLISHALDRILENPKPHGIQVGFATIFTMTLRGSEFTDIIKVYDMLGFPTMFDSIGIPIEKFIEAVRLAPYTRKDRFTILDLVREDEETIMNALRLAYKVNHLVFKT
ncbi:MAG: iron-containing alcohol dehydrogenase [Candidatus Nitrosocaldus sp.]